MIRFATRSSAIRSSANGISVKCLSGDEVVYRSGAVLARLLPRVVGTSLTQALGASAYRMLSERRYLTERRIQRVCGGGLGDKELAGLVRASFQSYARYWYDGARICGLSDSDIQVGFRHEGFEHIAEACASGVAPILVLPHLGGWEWAGAWMARVAGYPVMSVVEPPANERLFEWMVVQRQRIGIDIVPLSSDAAAVLIKALRSGQVVCLLSDRQVGSGGVEVEFFGETTMLPAGPAIIALRTGAALLPTAVYQEAINSKHSMHRGVVMAPIVAERRGRLREDVGRVTQDLARCLEQLIRAAPEQWHLMQPNWPSDREALDKFWSQKTS
ncbi:MAG: phosphatidylinositol mannoside acyltransferase [Acidimicrobiia bacterium]|nr:phosphatidylinositol mannoside acyltransferase [Acidimicrobiia bacterium]MYC57302.1 phosphatidylinositol mannoside acyltransferase [Acidimicrobiia bacterium]MYG94505.1 phosphatidylinositol mannoside acyltransferase [Acidimicrobiia bacterium]MYI31003.1 phosphatidylinositol mannoside acyltransferase [Acidimicrobiia bacterium]